MDELELTLLSDEDIWGNDSLNVFHKYGTIAAITDLVILTGGYFSGKTVFDDNSLKGRVGLYYTSSSNPDGDDDNDVFVVDSKGALMENSCSNRNIAIRPVLLLPPMIFAQITKNKVTGYNGVCEVEYGEYPQYVPAAWLQRDLEEKYSEGHLLMTGRAYTFDRTDCRDSDLSFQRTDYPEYEYNGKRYIRILANSYYFDKKFRLSNGSKYKNRDKVWVEVSPVVWLIDDKSKKLISKRCLLAGIRFLTPDKHYDGNFSATELKWYLDNYMVKDLFQTANVNERTVQINEKSEKIFEIVDEIKKLLGSYYGAEDIMVKVDNLISKYNSDIDEVFDNKSQGLVLSTNNMDKDFLYIKLVSDLEEILSKVKQSSEKYREYAKMLELTKKCLSILDGEISDEISDDLLNDIVTIKQIILPFLSDDSKLSQIKKIFLEEEDNIISYLKGNENCSIKQYQTLDEFKLFIRKKLQPYLVTLNTVVRNKDLANEIQEGYVKLLEGIFEKSRDDYVSHFLGEIQILILEISVRGNDKEREKMQIILANKIEFDADLTKSLTAIVELYISLYKVLLDIEKREEHDIQHQNYKIDFKK